MAKHVVRGLERFRLDNRVAVVTGGAGLLGQQFCHALAEAGAIVVVADSNHEATLAVTSALSHSTDLPSLAVEVDVKDPKSVDELRRSVLGHFDHIDILINSAAINDRFDPSPDAAPSRFEDYPLQMWQDQLQVNLTGTFLTCQSLGSQMAKQGSGSIINIGSTYGLVAPDQRIYQNPDGSQQFFKSAGYAASKGGVVMLTRFVATYWGQQGVRANVLCPGGVAQQQAPHFVSQYASRTPMGRMAQPEEITGAAVFLASEASAYMTGAVLSVDGGWTAW